MNAVMKNKTIIMLAMSLLPVTQPIFAAEDYPSVEFGGRVQADATYFDNDKYSYTDGSEVRRARVFWRGDLNSDWDYKAQWDFAGDEVDVKDAYLRYSGFDNSRITLGHFKPFGGLEFLTSSNNATFNERAMVNGFQGDRRLGAGYQRWIDRYTFQAAAYTHEANNAIRGNGVSARFAYRPAIGDGQFLHLGINANRETDDNDSVRFRARPDSHQDSHRIIDTGTIANVDNLTKLGLEAAYVSGPFSAQAEWINQQVNRNVGADLSFTGYYAYASYFLTADSRPYSNSDAAFGTVSPSSDKGAWEIAARISNLDLTDETVAGGKADVFTLGVNYYMTRDIRFAANYIMADSDAVAGDDDPNAIQLRVRITF